MQIKRLLVSGAVVVAVLGAGAPAMAADTTASFTVFSGAVSVTAPATKNFGFVAQGSSVSDTLGIVEVTDSRSPTPGTWTATVLSTDFSSGGNTFAASSVTYTAGSCTATGVTCTPAGAFSLSNSAQTAAAGSSSTTGSTASWNPTFAFTVPVGQATGAYSATVTHSVS